MGGSDRTQKWNVVQRPLRAQQHLIGRLAARGWLLNHDRQRRQAQDPGLTQPLSGRALRRQMAREQRKMQQQQGVRRAG